jgi:hypothetical protein
MAFSRSRLFANFIRRINADLTVKTAGLEPAARVTTSDVLDSAQISSIVTASSVDSAQVSAIVGGTAEYLQLNQTGTLEVTSGTVRWVAPKDINISEVESRVGTAPTGSSLITTLNKNGSAIDTQTIAADGTSDTNTGLSLAVAENDYLTVDITQIGSTVAGSDLNVIVKYVDG